MEYSKFAEPLMMYHLDTISRQFGVALIKRVNITTYNYDLETPLIEIFGTLDNLRGFIKAFRETNVVDPEMVFDNAVLRELIVAMFSHRDESTVMYPNIASDLVEPKRSRLVLTPSETLKSLNVTCDAFVRELITRMFKHLCLQSKPNNRTPVSVILDIGKMTRLQSFFPDEYKFDPTSVYEVLPISGFSKMVTNVSVLSPMVVMQRSENYIASFTFNGFIVRKTLACMHVRSMKTDALKHDKTLNMP